MVINMNETKLRTMAQLQDFLKVTPEVRFSGVDEKKKTKDTSTSARYSSALTIRSARNTSVTCYWRTYCAQPRADQTIGGTLAAVCK